MLVIIWPGPTTNDLAFAYLCQVFIPFLFCFFVSSRLTWKDFKAHFFGHLQLWPLPLPEPFSSHSKALQSCWHDPQPQRLWHHLLPPETSESTVETLCYTHPLAVWGWSCDAIALPGTQVESCFARQLTQPLKVTLKIWQNSHLATFSP